VSGTRIQRITAPTIHVLFQFVPVTHPTVSNPSSNVGTKAFWCADAAT